MAHTQHDGRVDEESTEVRTESADDAGSTARTVARLLANPRRVRRA